jgi:hypothetical protein
MARSKVGLGAGARFADYLSAGLLARVFPAEVIHEVLDVYQCNSERVRTFPATAVVYYTMALSLYSEAAYEDVFAAVAQGLAWKDRTPHAPVAVVKSAVSKARSRLTWKALHAIQQRCCLPLASPDHPHAFFAGYRLVAMDGSNFEVADEKENVAVFGYPGSRTGHAGYPQAQCAILTECGSHAILDAELGSYRQAEWEVAEPLLRSLTADMLCMADRGFVGYAHWQAGMKTGAQLLWRMPKSLLLPVEKQLDDGSYLSHLYPSERDRKKQINGIAVRVIEYTLPHVPDSEPMYRLLTTLLDERIAPAQALAALYHERWEVELVFDELKTHLVQRRRVLRSKTPELVRQEFYGWVMAHYAVRWLMYQGAAQASIPERTLSFTANVQLLRRNLPQSGVISPCAPEKMVPATVRRRGKVGR